MGPETGIFKGSGVTAEGEPIFKREDFVTREELAEMMYRYKETVTIN